MVTVKTGFRVWALVTVSAISLSAGSALAAPITFNFGAPPTSSSSTSISYSSNGFAISIGVPQGTGSPVMNALTNVGGTGNGVCVFSDYGANPATSASWCGQAKPNTLSSTTWSFTSPTGGAFRPLSYTLRGVTTFPNNTQAASFSSTWTGMGRQFSDTRTVPATGLGATAPAITVNFAPNSRISSGSSFSLSTINNNVSTPVSYRIQSFTLEEVPGPLPIFGLAAAFTYSRKIRKRLRSTQ